MHTILFEKVLHTPLGTMNISQYLTDKFIIYLQHPDFKNT